VYLAAFFAMVFIHLIRWLFALVYQFIAYFELFRWVYNFGVALLGTLIGILLVLCAIGVFVMLLNAIDTAKRIKNRFKLLSFEFKPWCELLTFSGYILGINLCFSVILSWLIWSVSSELVNDCFAVQ